MYENKVKSIIKKSNSQKLNKDLKLVKNKLAKAIKINQEALNYFEDKNFLKDLKKIKIVSNFMHFNKNKLLTNSKILISEIDEIIVNYRKEKAKLKNLF